MKLPRIPFFTLLSLALLCVVIAAAVRSRKHADILSFYTPSGHMQAVAADRKGLVFVLSDIPFGGEVGLSFDSLSVTTEEFATIHQYLFDPTSEKWHLLGFHQSDGTIAQWGWKFHALVVPYWALIVILAVLPVGMLRNAVRTWRWRRTGRCPACGYDLRHSSDRCPECGAAIPTKLAAGAAAAQSPS